MTSSGWVIPSYTKTLETGSETEGWLPPSLEASTDALGYGGQVGGREAKV